MVDRWKLVRAWGGAGAACLAVAGTVNAQSFLGKLETPLLRTEDRFGSAIEITNDLVVASAPNRFIGGSSAGQVFLYERDGSGQLPEFQTIPSTTRQFGEEFGASIALSGPWLAIGAPRRNVGNEDDAGRVDIFVRSGGPGSMYSLFTTLSSPDLSDGDLFGSSVAFIGDTLAVGAPLQDSIAFADSGAIYLFREDLGGEDNWGFQLRLTVDDQFEGQRLGETLESGPGVLLAGCQFDNDVGTQAGSVYVFVPTSPAQNNWVQIHEITDPEGQPDDRFGSALSLFGDRLAVGSPLDDEAGSDSGSVTIFRMIGGDPRVWERVRKLVAPDSAAFDAFGTCVSLYDGLLLAGAPFDDPVGLASGSAHLFDANIGSKGSWGHVTSITDPMGSFNDGFGERCALGDGLVLIGALRDDNELFDSTGTVCAYGFEFTPCGGDANGDRIIDMADLTSVIGSWLADYTGEPSGTGPGDANEDGRVDFADATAVLLNWQGSCGIE